MSRINVPSRSRASSHLGRALQSSPWWALPPPVVRTRARFDSNPYASNRQAPAQQETTGSISSRPATSARVESQPLPAPSRPATVAARGRRRHRRARPGRLPARHVRRHRIGAAHARRADRALDLGRRLAGDGQLPAKRSRASRANTACRRPPSCETNGFREGGVAQAGPARGHSALRLGQRDRSRAAAAAPRDCRKRAHRRARRKHDRHRAQTRRDAHGLGARQQHPALCQDQHRRPPDHPGRPAASPRARRRRRRWRSRARFRPRRSPACRRRVRASPRPSTRPPKA